MKEIGEIDSTRAPGRVSLSMDGGTLVLVDGKWTLDTDPNAMPDAQLVEVDRKPAADDEAVTGLRLIKARRRIHAI